MRVLKVFLMFLFLGLVNDHISKTEQSENNKEYSIFYEEMSKKRMTRSEFDELVKRSDKYLKNESSYNQLSNNVTHKVYVKTAFYIGMTTVLIVLFFKGLFPPKQFLYPYTVSVFFGSFVFLSVYESILYCFTVYILMKIYYFFKFS